MKIVIATGGTGGHIIPALQTAAALKRKGHELLLIGTFGSWIERVKRTGLPVKELHAQGLTFSSFTKFYEASVAMIMAIRHALISLKKFDPDIVVGFGGYGAFPVVMGARLLRYPALIHEQNVVPGRANQLLGKFVNRIAVSFEESKKYFVPDKVIRTGCPCNFDPREERNRTEGLKRFGFEETRTTILVLGGSQGSRRINEVAFEVIKELSRQHALQVLHISGVSDFEKVKSSYQTLNIPFKVFDFCEEMPVLLQLADLAVARAGALTVTETALAGIPTIFVPYPYAGGHQKENALALVKTGAAKMIEEKNLNAENLQKQILEILNGPSREQIKGKLKTVAFDDAAERLSDAIAGINR